MLARPSAVACAARRSGAGRGRGGVCCAALSAREAHPLRDASAGGGLSPSLAALRGGGVFAVFDSDGALQYVGVSRQLASSLATLARSFGSADDAPRAASAAAQPLPGASAAALQAAWREAVAAHGALPPGNTPGADARWAARPAAAPAQRAADVDAQRWASQRCAELLTPQRCAALTTQGFVIIDGALSEATCAAARRAAEALDAAGGLRGIPAQAAQGRRDRSAALALPSPGAAALAAGAGAPPLPPRRADSDSADAAALAEAAALLMAVPAALMAASPAGALPQLAPPQSLQLAVYDSDGAFYARHVDNPGALAPGAREGPPGLRTGDRAVTAIVYLNPAWRAEDGGQLRLWPPGEGEAAAVDVEPRAGRLLLFDATRVEHEVRPARATRWALSAWVPRADACVA